MTTKQTAIITDPIYEAHETGPHPERPARAATLRQMAGKLLADPAGRFVGLEATAATVESVTAVHTVRYVQALERFCAAGGGPIDLNTTVSVRSYEVALYAAGGLLQGVKAVLAGRVGSAFVLGRPPGHHAEPEGAEGFCLFNNVAIAARYLLDVAGLERVLIVDWDVHHGNGTQDIFYDDPRVLFFSTHQSPLYPGSGGPGEIGNGRGHGFNVNVPLPQSCGDEVLAYVFEYLLEPLAARFRPQFVLVSAGYDGHWRDPLAGLNLSARGYAALTRRVMALADRSGEGRLALTLEGGYDLGALTASARATLLTLAQASTEEALQEDEAGDGPGGLDPQSGPLPALWRQLRTLHKL